MAISRYWRLVGIATPGNGPLELSEARIYEAGVLADASATLTATIAPAIGELADLLDGLATGVVSWPGASYTSPGFALVWDFGAGGGVEFPQLRLGSGNSTDAFTQDITFQKSDDGINWITYTNLNAVAYPGVTTLTAEPSGENADPNSTSVTLLLTRDVADQSRFANSVTNLGGVTVSTAKSRFGISSLYFDGSGGLSIPARAELCDLNDDFALEAWVYLVDSTKISFQMLDARTNGGTSASWVWTVERDVDSVYKLCLFNGVYNRAPAEIPLNQWINIVTTRTGNTIRHFLNGVVIGSSPLVGTLNGTSSTDFVIGGKDGALYKFKGYMDGLRISNGVPRYTAGFTPTSFYQNLVLPVDGARPHHSSTTFPVPDHLLPAIELPPTTAHGALREFPFFDVYNGGIGLITGTVKEKSLPSNVPLARKVWLMDEASGMVVRETWSDAITGTYEFRGVKQGVKYTVLAYDYSGLYRAVIADAQVPGVMP